jgi:hypothetical protein
MATMPKLADEPHREQASRMKVIHDESACRVPAYCERHYSPAELAELWNLSVDTLRRLFVNEPGVLQISSPRRGRRNYATMRIPETVAERVHRKLSSV